MSQRGNQHPLKSASESPLGGGGTVIPAGGRVRADAPDSTTTTNHPSAPLPPHHSYAIAVADTTTACVPARRLFARRQSEDTSTSHSAEEVVGARGQPAATAAASTTPLRPLGASLPASDFATAAAAASSFGISSPFHLTSTTEEGATLLPSVQASLPALQRSFPNVFHVLNAYEALRQDFCARLQAKEGELVRCIGAGQELMQQLDDVLREQKKIQRQKQRRKKRSVNAAQPKSTWLDVDVVDDDDEDKVEMGSHHREGNHRTRTRSGGAAIRMSTTAKQHQQQQAEGSSHACFASSLPTTTGTTRTVERLLERFLTEASSNDNGAAFGEEKPPTVSASPSATPRAALLPAALLAIPSLVPQAFQEMRKVWEHTQALHLAGRAAVERIEEEESEDEKKEWKVDDRRSSARRTERERPIPWSTRQAFVPPPPAALPPAPGALSSTSAADWDLEALSQWLLQCVQGLTAYIRPLQEVLPRDIEPLWRCLHDKYRATRQRCRLMADSLREEQRERRKITLRVQNMTEERDEALEALRQLLERMRALGGGAGGAGAGIERSEATASAAEMDAERAVYRLQQQTLQCSIRAAEVAWVEQQEKTSSVHQLALHHLRQRLEAREAELRLAAQVAKEGEEREASKDHRLRLLEQECTEGEAERQLLRHKLRECETQREAERQRWEKKHRDVVQMMENFLQYPGGAGVAPAAAATGSRWLLASGSGSPLPLENAAAAMSSSPGTPPHRDSSIATSSSSSSLPMPSLREDEKTVGDNGGFAPAVMLPLPDHPHLHTTAGRGTSHMVVQGGYTASAAQKLHDELTGICQATEAHNHRLEEELYALRKKLSRVSEDLERAESRLQQRDADTNSERHVVEGLRDEVTAWKRKAKALEQHHADVTGRLNRCLQECEQLTRERDEQASALAQVGRELVQQKRVSDQNEAAQAIRLQHTQQDVERLTASMEKQREELTRHESRHEREMQGAAHELSIAKQTIQRLEKEIEACHRERRLQKQREEECMALRCTLERRICHLEKAQRHATEEQQELIESSQQLERLLLEQQQKTERLLQDVARDQRIHEVALQESQLAAVTAQGEVTRLSRALEEARAAAAAASSSSSTTEKDSLNTNHRERMPHSIEGETRDGNGSLDQRSTAAGKPLHNRRVTLLPGESEQRRDSDHARWSSNSEDNTMTTSSPLPAAVPSRTMSMIHNNNTNNNNNSNSNDSRDLQDCEDHGTEEEEEQRVALRAARQALREKDQENMDLRLALRSAQSELGAAQTALLVSEAKIAQAEEGARHDREQLLLWKHGGRKARGSESSADSRLEAGHTGARRHEEEDGIITPQGTLPLTPIHMVSLAVAREQHAAAEEALFSALLRVHHRPFQTLLDFVSALRGDAGSSSTAIHTTTTTTEAEQSSERGGTTPNTNNNSNNHTSNGSHASHHSSDVESASDTGISTEREIKEDEDEDAESGDAHSNHRLLFRGDDAAVVDRALREIQSQVLQEVSLMIASTAEVVRQRWDRFMDAWSEERQQWYNNADAADPNDKGNGAGRQSSPASFFFCDTHLVQRYFDTVEDPDRITSHGVGSTTATGGSAARGGGGGGSGGGVLEDSTPAPAVSPLWSNNSVVSSSPLLSSMIEDGRRRLDQQREHVARQLSATTAAAAAAHLLRSGSHERMIPRQPRSPYSDVGVVNGGDDLDDEVVHVRVEEDVYPVMADEDEDEEEEENYQDAAAFPMVLSGSAAAKRERKPPRHGASDGLLLPKQQHLLDDDDGTVSETVERLQRRYREREQEANATIQQLQQRLGEMQAELQAVSERLQAREQAAAVTEQECLAALHVIQGSAQQLEEDHMREKHDDAQRLLTMESNVKDFCQRFSTDALRQQLDSLQRLLSLKREQDVLLRREVMGLRSANEAMARRLHQAERDRSSVRQQLHELLTTPPRDQAAAIEAATTALALLPPPPPVIEADPDSMAVDRAPHLDGNHVEEEPQSVRMLTTTHAHEAAVQEKDEEGKESQQQVK